MNVEITMDRKSEMKFTLQGADHGFAKLLMSKLLSDEDVEIATYNVPHPLTGNPEFYVKIVKGTPKDAVQKALKALKREIKGVKA